MFTCDKCGKDFDTNFLLNRHITSKRACNTIYNINKNYNEKIEIIDKEVDIKIQESLNSESKCIFCEKMFLNKGNIIRHIQSSCKIKKELIDKKNKLIEIKNDLIFGIKKLNEKDEEIKYLKKKVEKLIKNSPNNIIINNTINNNTQNNYIININSFGNEDLSHITIDDYNKYLNGFFPGFVKFIEKVHFDKNMPENHNMCLSNLKSKYMHVYENNGWILKERNDVIENLVNKKYDMLVDKYDELEESGKIGEKTIKNFEEFQKNYDNEEAQRNTKKDTMLMVYNNKDKVKNKIKKD